MSENRDERARSPLMTDRIEAIRARHAARRQTRAAKWPKPVQPSTLVDDDMEALLAEVDRLRTQLDRLALRFMGAPADEVAP